MGQNFLVVQGRFLIVLAMSAGKCAKTALKVITVLREHRCRRNVLEDHTLMKLGPRYITKCMNITFNFWNIIRRPLNRGGKICCFRLLVEIVNITYVTRVSYNPLSFALRSCTKVWTKTFRHGRYCGLSHYFP